jgi:hypothetical protein
MQSLRQQRENVKCDWIEELYHQGFAIYGAKKFLVFFLMFVTLGLLKSFVSFNWRTAKLHQQLRQFFVRHASL